MILRPSGQHPDSGGTISSQNLAWGLRLARGFAFFFAGLTVVALVGAIVVDAAFPDQAESWGLLAIVVMMMAGPIAAICAFIVGVGVYGIHRSRVGRAAIAVVGILLLVWLGRSLVHG
jgi:hypothetical protein